MVLVLYGPRTPGLLSQEWHEYWSHSVAKLKKDNMIKFHTALECMMGCVWCHMGLRSCQALGSIPTNSNTTKEILEGPLSVLWKVTRTRMDLNHDSQPWPRLSALEQGIKWTVCCVQRLTNYDSNFTSGHDDWRPWFVLNENVDRWQGHWGMCEHVPWRPYKISYWCCVSLFIPEYTAHGLIACVSSEKHPMKPLLA